MRNTFVLLIFLSALISCKSNLYVHDFKAENISNFENISTIDSSLVEFLEPFRADVDRQMSVVVAETAVPLIRQKPESLITNYLGDIILRTGQAWASRYPGKPIPQAAYLNYGSVRCDLPKGEITVGNVFELMPFENELVLLKLKGEDLYAMAEMIAKRGGESVAGMKIGIKDGQLSTFTIDNQPVERSRFYWLATNDYAAGGGDDMKMFLNRATIIRTEIKLRDCFIDYMRDEHNAGNQISPKLDGRIYNE